MDENIVRIVLVGNSNVGKTSIIRKYTEDKFSFDTDITASISQKEITHFIEIDLKKKKLKVDDL